MKIERVLMVTPEYYGVAMVGGLGMAVSGLSKALTKKGVEVKVIMPHYAAEKRNPEVLSAEFKEIQERDVFRVDDIEIKTMHKVRKPGTYSDKSFEIDGAIYRHEDPSTFFDFVNFSKKVSEEIRKLNSSGWKPDVVHLHEWHTAPIAYMLRDGYYDPGTTPTALTIHNARYAGKCPVLWHDERIREHTKSEAVKNKAVFATHDRIFESCLEFGLAFSHAANTVSQGYLEEILSGKVEVDPRVREQIAKRGVIGIINGIDTELMNPATDKLIPKPYSYKDLANKNFNKIALQDHFGLAPDTEVMVVSMISRLAEQKGISHVINSLDEIAKYKGVQLVIVGEPDKTSFKTKLEYIKDKYPNIRIRPNFVGPAEQHLVLAGSDAILMPSAFEPCGLSQLEGMAYGAIPIATHVGGLKDTVVPVNKEKGYSIIIRELSPVGIIQGIKQAYGLFRNKPRFGEARVNAMTADFRWNGAKGQSTQYLDMYAKAIEIANKR